MGRKPTCLCGTCQKCKNREYNRLYRERHREKIRERAREWHDENREARNAYMREHIKKPEIAARRADYDRKYKKTDKAQATAKAYRQRPEVKKRMVEASRRFCKTEKRRTYMRDYCRESRANNLNVRLAHRLRSRLTTALRGRSKRGSAVRDLGCSIEELKGYLEERFEPEMSWDNWGANGWHIDHIKPLSSFDLTDREQFLEATHYSNLQPMWASENMSKNSSVGV